MAGVLSVSPVAGLLLVSTAVKPYGNGSSASLIPSPSVSAFAGSSPLSSSSESNKPSLSVSSMDEAFGNRVHYGDKVNCRQCN